ncbi:hypothetical protein [Simkania sp.]|uniref:hypothetical protein n=1 Tax=Simkania sp. TaxID=34094 RepID=UPI003B526F19
MSLSGLTPQSYLLGTLISAASLKIGETLASEEKSWRAQVVVFGVLGIGGVLATPLSRSLSNWTGTILTHTQSLLIFGVVATFKAIGVACERFLFLKDVTGPEEVRNLYDIQLRPLHTHFRAHPDKFEGLDLLTQTILNKRFSEQKFAPIASQTFTEIGTDYSKDELDFLADAMDLSKLPSLKDRQKVALLLYENDYPPIAPSAREDYDLLSTAELTEDAISTLSPEKIRWIRMALRNGRPVPQSPKAFSALAQAFFHAKLTPPENIPLFFLRTNDHPHPSSYSPVSENETYMIPWLKNYYAYQYEKWAELPLQTQLVLNVLFSGKAIYYPLTPNESDFPLASNHLQIFNDHFKEKRASWHTLPLPVQQKFHEAFENATLETFASIEEASDEEFEAALTSFMKSPFLFHKLPETQRRTICTRALEMWHTPSAKVMGTDPASGYTYYRMPNGDIWRKKKSGNAEFKRFGTPNFVQINSSHGQLNEYTEYRCNEEGIFYQTRLMHIQPFVDTMDTLLTEKSEKTTKNLMRVLAVGGTLIFAGAIWSFCHILMHGPVIDMQPQS